MTEFETILKKADLKTVEDKETATLNPVIRIYFEVPFRADLWEFIGEAAGDVVTVLVDRKQGELFNKKTGEVK